MDAKDLAYSAERGGTPPTGVSDAIKALWLARAGRWEEAHTLCKSHEDGDEAWVHAHLHRVKGDADNAEHWYAKTENTHPVGQTQLGEEWLKIATALLAKK